MARYFITFFHKKMITCYNVVKERPDTMTVRIHLRRLLFDKKMSQKKLADITGIRPSTIGDYCHEMIERVTLNHVAAICAALDCRLDELLEIVPDDEDSPGGDLGT